jgi:hypothetical protein
MTTYNVNGKTITDYPILDEMCYICKVILKNIVIKNDVLAQAKETENSLSYAEMNYLLNTYGTITFDQFYFTQEILEAYGYSPVKAKTYLNDRYTIPEEDRIPLTEFSISYFVNHFEEENDYYRMLAGLPPYNSGTEYYIWLTEDDIPAAYNKPVEYDKPLHEQPRDLINVLYAAGTIDNLRTIYKGFNYSYMMHLGDKSIPFSTSRAGAKWDILYMPNVNNLVKNKFIDFYKVNREMYINRSYQEFFSQTGEYYDQMMIVIVLCQTFSDLVVDTPEWYIRRDIFDLRSCKFFLESYGVEYFKIIPLKYQIRIVKNLNKLIKYKSSAQNFEDILDIFDIPGTKLFKYWLYKKADPEAPDGYILQFISSEYNQSYDNYIRDTKFRYGYNGIVSQDTYWDGEDTHSLVESEIKAKDFSIEGTKYMSIEYQISMSDYLYQMEYMLGLILDSAVYKGFDDFKIAIPSINDSAMFNISDIFLFLAISSASFSRANMNSRETLVRTPDDMSEGTEPYINEMYYDWKKKYFPEMFVLKNGRIFGFNPTLDKDKLISILERRHSHLVFGYQGNDTPPLNDEEYNVEANKWIDSLRIRDYIIPSDSITSVKTLYNVYRNNTEIYHLIKDQLTNVANKDDQVYLNYIFQELFTRPFDVDFITNPHGDRYTDLIDILKTRDYILYEEFYNIMQEPNIESKQDTMRSVMNDVIDTLDYYLNREGLNFLYSFVSIESFGAMVEYLYLMFNFFKSYKVFFLDPYYTLITDDKEENSTRAYDVIKELRYNYNKYDKALIDDAITGFDIERYFQDEGESNRYTDTVDIYAHYEDDPFEDLDIDGVTAEKGETEPTEDVDGGEADDKTVVRPYKMLNGGGSAGARDVNFRDINGADANEGTRHYYQVDGGDAFTTDDIRTDVMGNKNFNYIIDGGSAGKREFQNNCFRIRYIGTEFIGDVIVSPKSSDVLFVKDDGLYMPENAFAKKIEFYNLVYSLNMLIATIRSEAAQSLEDLQVLTDENYRIARIQSVLDDLLANMDYCVYMMQSGVYKDSIIAYIDSVVASLTEEFDKEEMLNPYMWVDL